VEALPNVSVIEPLDYASFCAAMGASRIILTDSGGVQEEAPSLGVPVLVLRESTERQEAVDAGTARLIGTDESTIVREVQRLLDNEGAWEQMSQALNPYGDGQAANRTVSAIGRFLGIGDPSVVEHLGEFMPTVRTLDPTPQRQSSVLLRKQQHRLGSPVVGVGGPTSSPKREVDVPSQQGGPAESAKEFAVSPGQ
jgi:UDP-N-acetylglucosamine 2-epimerase